MTRTDPRATRALAQIDGLTSALFFLVVALLMLTVPFAVFGSGSVLGFGDDEVCATVRPGEVPFGAREPENAVVGLAPDARWYTDTITICRSEPGLALRLIGSLHPIAEVGFFLGALFLVRRVVRHARHRGLFAGGVATRVRTLGRFLVVAAPTSALLVAVADAVVLDAAVRGVTWRDHVLDWDFPWAVLLVGVGLVSMAKVWAYARVLQQDVDGTI